MPSEYQQLNFSPTGNIVEITLNQAGRLNAIDIHMHREIARAFNEARHLPDIRAIVFAANGKAFSAGGQFEEILADREHPERKSQMADDAQQLFTAVAECPLPIVAALHGDAVGLGATLVLTCDAVVAARTARISDPHIVIGLAAGDGGCVTWPQSAGLLRAKRYLLTGDRIPAEAAYSMGLVTDLVDTAADCLPAARALAGRIAALPPLAVQHTKRALNQLLRHRTQEVFEFALRAELETFFSDDCGEAIAAMREKRPGRFVGR
jgi:enoyl-CoA hydratase